MQKTIPCKFYHKRVLYVSLYEYQRKGRIEKFKGVAKLLIKFCNEEISSQGSSIGVVKKLIFYN